MDHTGRPLMSHTVKTSLMGHTVKDLLTMDSNIRSSCPQAAEWTPVHAAVNGLRQAPFRDDGPRSRISSFKADDGPRSRPSSLTADGLSVDETSGVKAVADFSSNRNLVAMIEEEIDRQLREAELFPDFEDTEEEIAPDPDQYPAIWNINTVSVGFWKSIHWPVGRIWSRSKASFVEGGIDNSGRSTCTIGIDMARQSNFLKNDKFNIAWHTLFWIFALGIFPIFYNTCLMATITGVYDEGLNSKTHIRGDGYYESWSWRYSGAGAGLLKFEYVYNETSGAKVGMTTRPSKVFENRDATEITYCQEDDLFQRINAYRSNGSHADFWLLIRELQDRVSPLDIFAHCFPWEYANLCANLIKANEKLTLNSYNSLPADVAYRLSQGMVVEGPEGRPWYITQCYPTDYQRRPLVSPQVWDVMISSTAQMRESSRTHLLPAHLEKHHKTVRWMLTKNMGDSKTLDSSDGSVSTHLYHYAHFVYHYSVGESALVEIICFLTLNFYLYYSTIYPELMQLLEQLILSCSVRPYEAALFREGIGTSPHCIALRECIVTAKQTKRISNVAVLYVVLASSDWLCDVFLGLRFCFCGIYSMATCMIVTLNHGNINVIFSIVALSFILDIDDCFMRVLANNEFKEYLLHRKAIYSGWILFHSSVTYREQILPCLVASITSDDYEYGPGSSHTSLHNNLARNFRNWPPSGQRGAIQILMGIDNSVRSTASASKRRLHGIKGNTILQIFAVLATTFLLSLQQFFSMLVATQATGNITVMKETMNWVFQEFTAVPWVLTISVSIFGFGCLTVLCYTGLIALPALLQHAVSLVWVYYVIFLNWILLGVLAWYSDVAPYRDLWGQVCHNTNQTAVQIFVPFGLHLLLCAIRPLILICYVKVPPESSGKPRASHKQDSREEFPENANGAQLDKYEDNMERRIAVLEEKLMQRENEIVKQKENEAHRMVVIENRLMQKMRSELAMTRPLSPSLINT